MGLFIKILLFLIVLALALPFVLKGPDGQPLMTLDTLKQPDFGISEIFDRLSEVSNPFSSDPDGGEWRTDGSAQPRLSGKTQVYSWRDEQGNMHFTNEPPPQGRQAKTIQVDPNINIMPAVKLPEVVPDSPPAPVVPEETSVPSVYAPEEVRRLMDEARAVEGTLQQRREKYE